MNEGSQTVVLVAGDEVAHGEVSVDAGLSLSVRLDAVFGELPAPGDEIVLRISEAVGGRCEYVATVELINPTMLIASDLELISAFQQRAIARVATDIPVAIICELEGDEVRDLVIPIQATIVDLSAAGVRLYCAVPLEVGYHFGFFLTTDFDRLSIIAEVLRREEVPRGFLHGSRLVGTTQREADTLHRYVLSEQIAQHCRLEQD